MNLPVQCWCGEVLNTRDEFYLHGLLYSDRPLDEYGQGMFRKVHVGETLSAQMVNEILTKLNDLDGRNASSR